MHRVVLALWHNLEWHEIPCGAHLCGVKPCCSPFHLDAQTYSENRRYYLEVEKPMRLALGGGREREPGED